MKTKNKFLKLKQLDRIEYLLAERKIEDKFIDFQPFGVIYLLVQLIIFIIAFGMLLLHDYPETAFSVLKTITPIMNVAKIVIPALIIFQIVSYIVYYSNKRKLKRHFKLI